MVRAVSASVGLCVAQRRPHVGEDGGTMSFFQRLVSYVINDVAVKALSNSRAFQRFALKTHYHVEDAKTMASTGSDALKSSFENYAPKVKEFSQAFRDEVARDLKKMK
ncbi:hypothetical protein PC120_g4430 [Phytophthora cactorum]|nr:hypothetical protein PC120_g4430 [Phytophthora cactorum]